VKAGELLLIRQQTETGWTVDRIIVEVSSETAEMGTR